MRRSLWVSGDAIGALGHRRITRHRHHLFAATKIFCLFETRIRQYICSGTVNLLGEDMPVNKGLIWSGYRLTKCTGMFVQKYILFNVSNVDTNPIGYPKSTFKM